MRSVSKLQGSHHITVMGKARHFKFGMQTEYEQNTLTAMLQQYYTFHSL